MGGRGAARWRMFRTFVGFCPNSVWIKKVLLGSEQTLPRFDEVKPSRPLFWSCFTTLGGSQRHSLLLHFITWWCSPSSSLLHLLIRANTSAAPRLLFCFSSSLSLLLFISINIHPHFCSAALIPTSYFSSSSSSLLPVVPPWPPPPLLPLHISPCKL